MQIIRKIQRINLLQNPKSHFRRPISSKTPSANFSQKSHLSQF